MVPIFLILIDGTFLTFSKKPKDEKKRNASSRFFRVFPLHFWANFKTNNEGLSV